MFMVPATSESVRNAVSNVQSSVPSFSDQHEAGLVSSSGFPIGGLNSTVSVSDLLQKEGGVLFWSHTTNQRIFYQLIARMPCSYWIVICQQYSVQSIEQYIAHG